MTAVGNTQLIEEIVQELAYTAPEDWKKILYYQEMEYWHDGSLRNKAAGQCWHGDAMQEYDRGFEIGQSGESYDAIKKLFEHSYAEKKAWKGMLVVIFESGKYSIEFFYDKTPLFDNDDEALDKLLSSN